MIEYEETPEFQKDIKKLTKKFRSLPEDMKTAKKAVIELRHIHEIDNLSTFEIPGYTKEGISFWKIKKFACKALKGRGVKSGIRVIYKWKQQEKKVVFLEIYFKSDQENENHQRIKNHLAG